MAQLSARRDLQCPYVRAKAYLAQSLQSAAEGGAEHVLTLHVTMREYDVEKDVLVRYGKGADPMHFDEPWVVHWTPKHGGPFPDFDGSLTVRAAEDYTTSVLELVGEYRPPLGQPGKLFDAVVGHRIAANTAQVLLKSIGDGMEARYREEEAQKRS